MPDRPYGRHRAPKRSSRTPRRIAGGLALPTAAAAALTFTATGAAMATGIKPHAVSFTQGAALMRQARAEALGADRAQDAMLARGTTSTDSLAAADLRAAASTRAARAQARQAIEARETALAHRWLLPIKTYTLTSGFGMRWGRLHAGEDFAAPVGTELTAMSSGTVIFAGQESGFGNIVKIRYWDGTVSYYGHMSQITAQVGDEVSPGDLVGYSGNTGHSTGPHLHLEIHPDGGAAVDPLPWLREHNLLP